MQCIYKLEDAKTFSELNEYDYFVLIEASEISYHDDSKYILELINYDNKTIYKKLNSDGCNAVTLDGFAETIQDNQIIQRCKIIEI